MKSVKTKIIALVLSCITISAVFIGGASIINSQRVVSADSARIMNLLCANRSAQINALFSSIEQSVNTLTVYASHRLDDMERFRTDPAYVADYTESLLDVALNAAQNTEGALTVYIRYNPAFTPADSGIFCSRSSPADTFEPLPPTDLSMYDPSDTEHVGWFYGPAEKKDGLWMPPYFNQNIGVEIISYVVPYYRGNELVGVVGMDIDFNVLKNIVANTTVYDTGYAFLTDEKALIAYHQDLSAGTDLTKYNQGEFREMAETLEVSQNSGDRLITYSYRGEKREAAFQSLLNGMRLVITSPNSEIDAQANMLILQIVSAVFIIVFIAVIFTVLYARRLVKPLLELNAAAKKIADGDMSVTITHVSEDEVGTLAESFRQTAAHLQKYISYINELAYRDSLTGVKNKTAYLEAVKQLDDKSRAERAQYGVIVFDINGLKQVNDTLGHDFGDILIMTASKLICMVFSCSPVYRIGGDEFVVLLQDRDYERCAQLLEQLEQVISLHNETPENNVKISIARGMAIYAEQLDLAFHDVFKRADSAMYRNKAEMKAPSLFLTDHI